MKQENADTLIEILRLSKNGEPFQTTSGAINQILFELMPNRMIDKSWILSRDNRIDLAVIAIAADANIETVIQHLTWKDFEGFVARILTENEYRCVESFRRRGNRLVEGMEIDVIGVKGFSILSIDAKMWGLRTGKSSTLVEAAKKQAIRTEKLSNQIERLSHKIERMKPGVYSLTPIMVTWLVEEIQFCDGVPVVPIFKLNSFLLDLGRYEDLLVSYEGVLESRLLQTEL
ncbi:MAG: hypothetical protein ACFFEF_01285 [Candidatus Thorarchaeota archaeon]